MVTLEQLKVLVAVAECDSLKQAASRVYKSQPALTLALKELENQLGVTLFDRNGYRIKLNSQGQIIYQKALISLSSVNDIIQTAKHFNLGHEEKITLAVEASFELKNILPRLEQCQQKYLHTQIVFKQQYLSGALELLQQGDVELAISPVLPQLFSVKEFESKKIGQGKLLNVATPKLLSRHQNLKHQKQLVNDYQVIVQDTGSATKGLNFDVQSAQRNWYVNDFSAKLSLIQSGMGWGRLPEYLVREYIGRGQLVVLELDDMPSELNIEYHLLKQKGNTLGPVATYLWQQFLT